MPDTALTRGQIENLLGVRMTGEGPYFIAASAIGPGGFGVSAAGTAPFSGQIFSNPGPGTLGELQRRQFTGPPVFSMDAAVIKDTRIDERWRVQLRLEALNVFNHVAFGVFSNNMAINSAQFGQITTLANAPRQLQFSLAVQF